MNRSAEICFLNKGNQDFLNWGFTVYQKKDDNIPLFFINSDFSFLFQISLAIKNSTVLWHKLLSFHKVLVWVYNVVEKGIFMLDSWRKLKLARVHDFFMILTLVIRAERTLQRHDQRCKVFSSVVPNLPTILKIKMCV